jgi:hypothetical protein
MYFQVLSPHRLIASSPKLYTDDAYYWPEPDTMIYAQPVYDRRAREFVFLPDTAIQSDTIHNQSLER